MKQIVIKIAANLSLAELDKQLLERAKIPVMLHSLGAAAYMGPSAPYQIIIPARYETKAKKILRKE